MDARLLPREHGAYAQLGFPLLSGLLLGSPGASSLLFAVAAILLFLANEPLVLLLGVRGKRLQQELAVPARRHLALRAVLAAAVGLAALWLAPPGARWLALVPAVLAAALIPVVLAKNLKTLPGEVVAAAAFASVHLPIAAGGGITQTLLWGPPLMWFAATVVATLCVHAIKARSLGRAPWVIPAAAWTAWLALLGALAILALLPGWRSVALAACLPLAGVVVLNHLAPSPKRLKQVGWTLTAANALALALLAAG
ncbi:MAG: hypothetical protein EPO27_17150 [Betaproteobacteria bacterium]|nr:MAG: hypothetical protein EPO27_17150 [Betaproteobacteria bacterium]